MTFEETNELLDEIREYDDLVKFQKEKSAELCKRYGIKQSQLGFLISVVASERLKKMGMKM